VAVTSQIGCNVSQPDGRYDTMIVPRVRVGGRTPPFGDQKQLGTVDADSLGVTVDKLLRIFLWVVVAVAPGGLLLLPVLAYRMWSHRPQEGAESFGPVSTDRLALPSRSA